MVVQTHEGARDLLRRIAEAKAVRRLCYSRLSKKSRMAHLSIMALSLSVFTMTVLPLLFDELGPHRGLFDLYIVVASVLILVATLHTRGERYEIRAERMSYSGARLDELYDALLHRIQSGRVPVKSLDYFVKEFGIAEGSSHEPDEPVDIHYMEAFERNALHEQIALSTASQAVVQPPSGWLCTRSIIARQESIHVGFILFFVLPLLIAVAGFLVYNSNNGLDRAADLPPSEASSLA